MAKNKPTHTIKSLRRMTVEVRLSGPLRFRVWLGLRLIRLGAWIIGCGWDCRKAEATPPEESPEPAFGPLLKSCGLEPAAPTIGQQIRCDDTVCKVDDGTFTEIVAKAIVTRLKEWPYTNTAADEAVKVLRPYLCSCAATSEESNR